MIDLKQFEKKWRHLHDKQVFIACSGGVDSVVLTFLLHKFCKKLTILHVNYNLRGQDSIKDEKFVEELAKNSKINFEKLNVDQKEFENKNTQLLARKLRYDWFNTKLINKQSILALGHHQDDQLETFYMNLARKSGNLGLACMLEEYQNFARPLLSFSKAEILEFAIKNKLSWREDISNASNKYTRNKLRNEFIPFLTEKIPTLRISILTLIANFQQNQLELENSMRTLILNVKKEGGIYQDDWSNLTLEGKILLLKEFDFTHKQVSEMDKLVKAENGKFIQNKSYKIHKDDSFLHVKKNDISFLPPSFYTEEIADLPRKFSKTEIYLDKAKIHGDLFLRPWEIGDRIFSIGMEGSQLISACIRDAKIPNFEKKNIYVLCDKQNIHCCIGIKIGKIAIANSSTKQILKITFQNPI